MYQTDDLRITSHTEVDPPVKLHQEYPLTEECAQTVHNAREAIHNILEGSDDRLLVVIGPCSVHDPKAAIEYLKMDLELTEALMLKFLPWINPETNGGQR